MIPKEIFFFWSGDTLSWMRYMTLHSFRKLNPNWKITLYTCINTITNKQWTSRENQDFCNPIKENYFEKIKTLDIEVKSIDGLLKDVQNLNPVYKSDIFRWLCLSKNGGFYSDMDILFIKSMDKLYEDVKNTKIVCCYGSNNERKHHSIGFMGGCKPNQYYAEIYNSIIQTMDQKNTQRYQIFGTTALDSKWSRYRHLITEPNNIHSAFYNLPMSVVYPFHWNSTDIFEQEKVILPDNCVGIHWYAGNPTSQKYNAILTEQTVNTYKNVFNHFAKELL